jgi:geranylgeranyl diphosphate synthase type I
MTSPEKSGKDRASDIREGKQTLITLKAKERGLDLSEYRRELTDKEIDELVERLDSLGIIQEVRDTALELVHNGKEIISILPDSEAKKLLIEIGDYFVTRGY